MWSMAAGGFFGMVFTGKGGSLAHPFRE